MVEGLYQTYALCTAQGDEVMHEAAETNHSTLVAVQDVPRENNDNGLADNRSQALIYAYDRNSR